MIFNHLNLSLIIIISYLKGVKTLKILHLGKLCPPNEGGMELFSYDLLEYLNKKGIEADLLCFDELKKQGIFRNFKYFACKMNIKLNSAPLSYDFVKTFKKIVNNYDIIHIHSPNPLAEILSLFTNKKIVIHWHSDIVKQKISYMLYKPVQQKILQKAVKIIATSPQYLNSSEQIANYKDKSVVIPLSLNPQRLERENQNEYEKINHKIKNKKVVLSVGRLVEYKGFEYLIEASKYLNDDTVVFITGGGPLYKALSQKIHDLNLQDKVFLLGRVDSISVFMKNCDLFCLPSVTRNEAFGLVLLEALYFGKPLVTTNVKGSGMNFVNKHSETGFVVPPKNPKALSEAINKILYDNVLYQKFSENALNRFRDFEIDSIGEKLINLYQNL